MNGPGHYREAERLLAEITMGRDIVEASDTAQYIAAAQAHATLALAAATAMATYSDGEMQADDFWAWHTAAGVGGVQKPDDPYAGMTNADVMSASELAEYDRDAEFALDAADEERHLADAEANDHHDAADDEPYEDDNQDEDGEF